MTTKAKKNKGAIEGALVSDKNIVDITDASASFKTISERQAKTNTKYGRLNLEYQEQAIALVKHLNKHEDIRVIRTYIDNMAPGTSKASMTMWFEKVAQVVVDDEGELFFDRSKAPKMFEAFTKAWWLAKPEAVYVPFNLDVELLKVIKRAEARLEKAKEGDVIDTDALSIVKELCTRSKENRKQAVEAKLQALGMLPETPAATQETKAA